MFLGQEFPITHGHVLFVLAWIQPFLDANSFEVRFPKVLEEMFVLVHHFFIQNAVEEMFLGVVFEGYFFYCLQIIVKTIFSFDVIDEPRLVGKPVTEMPDGEWQYIVKRFDGGEESAIVSLLETDELEEAMTFVVHFLPNFREFEHIGVGKVCLDGDGRIEDFLHVSEKQEVDAGNFGEPTIGEV